MVYKLAANKYYYIDIVPQSFYDVHFNLKVKGVAVVNLPTITRVDRNYKSPNATLAMLGRMTLNDVGSSNSQCHAETVSKMQEIKTKYNISQAEFIHFDENRLYSSTNKNIIASFYEFKNGNIIAIICNTTKLAQSAILTIHGYNNAYDIWNEKTLKMKNETLSISLPPRMFDFVLLEK